MNRTNSPAPAEVLAREYSDALREYVCGGGEAALTHAYELGRKATTMGVGILDLAIAHHEALLSLPAKGAGDRPPVEMAAQFLAESLSPFEMTLRSYQANARLLGLSETLAQQNAEIDRSREQLRTILDATTAVIYLKDAEGRYLFVNRQFEKVFGLRRERVMGKLDEEVLPPAAAKTLRGDDLLVVEARAPRELEEIILADDGAHTYISLKFPLLDASDVAYGVCCVATDITERKRVEEALQHAREAAEREQLLKEAVKARDQFLAIASHELKTPLTALELQVASLRRLTRSHPDAAVSDERVQSRCETIARQVGRLSALIENIVDIGRITSGRLRLSPARTDLGELVRVVLGRVQEAIRRSGSEVALRVAAPVVGSWDRLRRSPGCPSPELGRPPRLERCQVREREAHRYRRRVGGRSRNPERPRPRDRHLHRRPDADLRAIRARRLRAPLRRVRDRPLGGTTDRGGPRGQDPGPEPPWRGLRVQGRAAPP